MDQHSYYIKEIDYAIRSNRTLCYINTFEEARILEALQKICDKKEKKWTLAVWDIARGLFINNKLQEPNLDQQQILEWFIEYNSDEGYLILVLLDYFQFLKSESEPSQIEIVILRQLKNILEECFYKNKTLIIIGHKYYLPEDLARYGLVIDWPLPEAIHIENKVTSMLSAASKNKNIISKFKIEYNSDEMQEITRSFMGLTLREIELLVTYFILTEEYLDPFSISNRKKDIIRKNGLLEWVDTDIDLNDIAGLDAIKEWLYKRKNAFSDEAREYGLPASPKGLLLIGVQGCGKSYFSKTISKFWNMPLLRLDIGKIFSGIVGSSEENLRTVIKLVESISPVILQIDELEKSFSNSSGNLDGGTTSRILGTFLTWMQENKNQVFIVATANDISCLPPEIIRKGRFDEIFFIDLPNLVERIGVFKIHLFKHGQSPSKFNLNLLGEKSDRFTSAEIEAAIISAMYESFSDGKRPLNTNDILMAINKTVPISTTMSEQINKLRTWASTRAVNASINDNTNINAINKYEEL